MIYYYSLRADTHDVSFINSFLAKYSTGTWMYCIEGTDNPHCHVYLESTFANTTLRVPIRKACGSGNGAYALKKCEHMPMKYFAYMTKDGNYFHKGLSEETIKEALEYDDKVKKDLQGKKTSRMTVLEKIIDKYGYDDNPPTWAPTIMEDVVSYYKETGTLVREFAMVSQIQTLCLKYLPEYKNVLQKRLIDKIFSC